MAKINVLHAKDAPYYPLTAAIILQDGDILQVQLEDETYMFKAMDGVLVHAMTFRVPAPDAPDASDSAS